PVASAFRRNRVLLRRNRVLLRRNRVLLRRNRVLLRRNRVPLRRNRVPLRRNRVPLGRNRVLLRRNRACRFFHDRGQIPGLVDLNQRERADALFRDVARPNEIGGVERRKARLVERPEIGEGAPRGGGISLPPHEGTASRPR